MSANPLQDAITINQSLKKPKNPKNIIQIVAHRSNSFRQKILQAHFAKFNKNLSELIESELSGNFRDTLVALFSLPTDYDAFLLYKAMKGIGTNEDTLIEVLASRSNEEIKQIKKRYNEIYKRDLVKDVEKDTSGFFRKILLELLNANRGTNTCPQEQECEECARRLYDSTIKLKGSEQDTFMYIFTQKSREELCAISNIYFKWYGKTLIEIVDSIFKGDPRRVLKAIIYSLLSPSEYFAYRINKAVKGFGTNDSVLIRIIVSRDDIDLYRIKRYYQQLYQKTLYEEITKDTSGDYRDLLLELIGN